MINLSILIPFLNEVDNIARLTSTIDNFCSTWDINVEVLYIDDGSTDNSIELLQKQEHNFYQCKIIKLSKNFGSHAALKAGIEHAKGQYLSFMYADLQDPIELQKTMYEKIIGGQVDIVWGTRQETKNSFFETAFSRFYSLLMKNHVNSNYPEKGFDVTLFNRKVQLELNRNIESNSSIFLQILNLGFSQATINYKKDQRKNGKSKWTFSKKVKLFIDSFVAFSYFPIKMVTLAGITFFALGIFWTLYIVSRAIIIDDLDTGWPALISILMIGFGVTNIGIGILAEYLWRTLDASQNRPVYVIDQVIVIK
jgi:glycosyltransferase involved in cell wall biosynthesis